MTTLPNRSVPLAMTNANLPFSASISGDNILSSWRGNSVIPTTNETAETGKPLPKRLFASDSVTGRLIASEPMFQENADLDIFRLLTRCLWFGLIVASPILVLWWLLVKAGGFSAILALMVFLFLLRFITPSSLFSLVRLSAMLNPLQRTEPNGVPVRYFRIRDQQQGDEYIVRIKGRFTAANLASDDLVTFEGKWKDGVLLANRAYSHRVRAFVRISESWSWLWFCLTMVFIGSLILAFREPILVIVNKIDSLHLQ